MRKFRKYYRRWEILEHCILETLEHRRREILEHRRQGTLEHRETREDRRGEILEHRTSGLMVHPLPNCGVWVLYLAQQNNKMSTKQDSFALYQMLLTGYWDFAHRITSIQTWNHQHSSAGWIFTSIMLILSPNCLNWSLRPVDHSAD